MKSLRLQLNYNESYKLSGWGSRDNRELWLETFVFMILSNPDLYMSDFI